MKSIPPHLTILLFITFLSATQSVPGQKRVPDRGPKPNSPFAQHEFDSVNLTNGGVTISIPLASLPEGRGDSPDFPISLNYSSKLWDMRREERSDGSPLDGGSTSYFAEKLIAADDGGWSLGIGYRLVLRSRLDVEPWQPCDGSIDMQRNAYAFKLELRSPDGSQRELRPQGFTDMFGDGYFNVTPNGVINRWNYSTVGDSSASCTLGMESAPEAMTYETVDGSHLKLVVRRSNANVSGVDNPWSLFFPNGLLVESLPPDDPSVLQRMTDRNGNRAYLKRGTFNGSEATIVEDDLGRQAVLQASPTGHSIFRRGFKGEFLETRIEWKDLFVMKTYNAADVFALNAPASTRNTELFQPMRVVSKVILPMQMGGLTYSFDYNGSAERIPGLQTKGWGELTSVALPTGARVDYRYKLDEAPAVSVSGDVLRNPITKRTLSYLEDVDGKKEPVSQTKSYSIGSDSSIFTDSDGNSTHTRFVSTESGSCDAGRVLSTTEPDGTVTENVWTEGCSNPYVRVEFRTLADGAGNPSLTSAVQIAKDSSGNLLEKHEYSYAPYLSVPRLNGRPVGVPSAMALMKSTVNEYYAPAEPNLMAAPNVQQRLRNALKASETRDAQGVAVSRSEFEYDDVSLRGNVVSLRQWDSTKGGMEAADARGFRLNAANAAITGTTYDRYGNVISVTDGRGFSTEFSYGTVGNVEGLYPTEKTEASRTSVALKSFKGYDFHTGLVVTETLLGNAAEENITNSFSFDAVGRLLRKEECVGAPSYRLTRHEYDDAQFVKLTFADRDTFGDGKIVAAEHFDQLGRIRLRRELEDGRQNPYDERQGIKTQFRYLIVGGKSFTLTSNPYRAETSDQAGAEGSMGWRLESVDNRRGLSESTVFAGGQAPAPWGSNRSEISKTSERSFGDIKLVTDEAGRRRAMRYDASGAVSEAWEIASSGDESLIAGGVTLKGFRTAYKHSAAGKLTTVSQGLQRRVFAYDSLSRMTSESHPESGTVNYSYDANGNRTSITDARGVVTRIFYDALNRIVNKSYSSESFFGYTPSPDVTYSYDDYRVPFSKGRLTRVHSAATDHRTLAYDAAGNPLSAEQITDGKSYSTAYRRDLAGNLIEQTYPSGRVVKSRRGDDGRLSIVSSRRRVGGYSVFATAFRYDASGSVRGARLGNGLWEGADFNANFETESISLGRTAGKSDLFGLGMEYGGSENHGNTVGVRITSVGEATRAQGYTYDELNRLSTAVETKNGSIQWRQSFRYDRYGNRRFDEESTSTIPRTCQVGLLRTVCTADRKRNNPSYNPVNNRIVSDQDSDGIDDYMTDPSGNVLKDPSGLRYRYDSDNRQVHVENDAGNIVGRYVYDGLGRRVKKIRYLNNQPEEVTTFIYDVSGRTLAEYSNKAADSSTAKVNYVTTDHLGSVRAVTDQYARMVSRHDYYPFGEEMERAGVGSDMLRLRFGGYGRDGEAQLDFAGARYYAFRLGRFTSADPLLSSIDIKRPQSLNRYSYVMNNPLRYIDPSGQDWIVNTGGDRASNPYKWVDRCPPGRSCWKTVAHDSEAGVRVYGTYGAKDVTWYRANEHGQINMESLLAHHDSKVESVAMSQGVPEPYLSTGAATILFNLGISYRASYPDDDKLVFANGNAANGKPCVYANGNSCHSGHKGWDMDLRYVDGDGRSLVGGSAYLQADPERVRFIVNFMRMNGFPESFSGNSSRLGTNPASSGTSRVHYNHLHIGKFDGKQ